MNQYTQKPSGHECPPNVDPAPHPKPPSEGDSCTDPPNTTPPTLEEPKDCPRDKCCDCPTTPPATSICLEKLIGDQDITISSAEQAKELKTQLELFRDQAAAGQKDYTQENYEKLVAEWVKQDAEIAELLRKLECSVWCWKCILDCYVCPLINDLHKAQKWLYDDNQLISQVHTLYDLKHWHERDKANKDRRLKRINDVLRVWTTTPAKTIEAVLVANRAIIDAAGKLIGSEPGKAIFDIFMKLVPSHLAVAPPEGSNWTTKIDKKFTEFCECGPLDPEDCCGPNVGELTIRQQFTGPQPYLIDPKSYYTLICCLIEKQFRTANDRANKAKLELDAVNAKIKLQEDLLADLAGHISKANDLIPSTIDCCAYEHDDEDKEGHQSLLS